MHYFPDNGFVGMPLGSWQLNILHSFRSVCSKKEALVTIYNTAGDVQATWPIKNSRSSQRSLLKPRLASKNDARHRVNARNPHEIGVKHLKNHAKPGFLHGNQPCSTDFECLEAFFEGVRSAFDGVTR